MSAPIFPRVGLLHFSTIDMRNVLCAVADAQHRHLAHKLAEVDLEGFGVVDREGRTGEDDTDDGARLQIRLNRGELVVR